MALFWRRRKTIEEDQERDKLSSIEVVEIKALAHQSATQTKKDIDKLNRLLKANGITLKIHIATHGGRNAK